jgi:hypothetical protein
VAFLSSLTCFLLFSVSIREFAERASPPERLDDAVVLIAEHRL